ncbi:proton channel OtopLc-like [Plodia interpunctella]|uniref:proton channel OtopLc-like n=1 Tax=Plodia interpunctella TaxID=58824 RepID=UPI002367EA3D|nr:proton channel OtopLc-like [Plodia interpunctella]
MAEDMNNKRQEILDEIINRKKMGDKKFHSETSLQHFDDDANKSQNDEGFVRKDPGVLNTSVGNVSEEIPERRRTMSQPGPLSGNLPTATAARMARRRGNRGVAYLDDSPDKQLSPKLVISNDDSGTTTPIGDKNYSPLQNGGYRNGDIKSLNSYRLYTPASEHGGTTPRKRSVVTMDAQSIRSVETHAPPPTHPKENKKQTKKYLSLIASCMYAILLVTVGFMVYLADSFLDLDPAVYYSLILCSIGFIYHIYLIIDIRRYTKIALKNQKIKALNEEKIAEFYRSQEEDYDINSPEDRPEPYRGIALPQILPLSHDYCFSQGRHSGSFYLKMGAAGFAMGHLVHSMLLIAVQINQLIDDDVNNDDCVNILQIVLDIMSPMYCFLQLFFIFKYSNVIILRAQGVAHFAFMHMIGSSLCFWISAIVRETILGLTNYANSRDDNYGTNETATVTTRNEYSTGPDRDFSKNFIDIDNLYNENCTSSPALTTIFENFSPYLYPFTVEFNIFIVAVYYIIWSNIGNCHNEEGLNSEINSSLDENYLVCKIPTANEDNDFTSNIVIHADCHASNRGLFVGLILMVGVAGMLILGFVFSSIGGDFFEVGYMLNDATRLAIHTALLFSVVFAYNQLRKLDINEHPVSLLDDVLLFICLPAFFMETLLSMVATINILNIVKSVDFMVMVIQVLVQTPLIMDGLRRCSNTKKLRRKKPGRELLMFLIIANVGMWLFYTFSFKSPESLDERYTFYGKVMWSILGHITLPLIMFYRFHSSVCFADIWNSAYKPGSEH